MSEKREGRLGWENRDGTVCPDHWHDGLRPVYVVPLDSDGPKPGETWRHALDGRVRIASPYTIDNDGSVVAWWAESKAGKKVIASREYLSPISPTRTVTVELTEEEAEAVRAMASRYQDGDLLTESGKAIHKLAEALEDE